MDFKSIKGKPHYLFDNLQEYKAFGNDDEVISSWRSGNEGDWVYTDDGYICQILKKSQVNHPGYKTPRTMIRTVCGSFICEQKSHTILGDNGIVENIYTFSGNSKSVKSYLKDRKMNNREFLFARYVVSGSEPTSAYKKAYPEAKNENYIKRKSNILLQKEEIRTMVSKEREELLRQVGVEPGWIVEQYKQIAQLSDSDSNKLRSLEALAKMSGLFDTEKKQEQLTVFQGFTPKQLEALQGGKETNMLAHAEKEEEE